MLKNLSLGAEQSRGARITVLGKPLAPASVSGLSSSMIAVTGTNAKARAAFLNWLAGTSAPPEGLEIDVAPGWPNRAILTKALWQEYPALVPSRHWSAREQLEVFEGALLKAKPPLIVLDLESPFWIEALTQGYQPSKAVFANALSNTLIVFCQNASREMETWFSRVFSENLVLS